MSTTHDSIDTGLAVRFLEEEAFVLPGRSRDTGHELEQGRTAVAQRRTIREKWLYVFRSRGALYAANDFPGVRHQRTQHLYGGQHIAMPGPCEVNPPSTGETAEEAVYECWFDSAGRLFPLSIADAHERDRPRHERIHPVLDFAQRVGDEWTDALSEELQLPLQVDGQPVRYYFLLSSFRLGPEGLAACLEPGAADGLSIWSLRSDGTGEVEVRAPFEELERYQHRSPGTEDELRRIASLTEIPVVDPYHFAGRINHHYLRASLETFRELTDDLAAGRSPDAVLDPRHLRPDEIGGTLTDVYVLAKALLALPSDQRAKLEWDDSDPRAVVEFVEEVLRESSAACDSAGLFLANWLDGPAHALMDRAVVRDTGDPDDPNAVRDRVYALRHWFNVTTLLGFTNPGPAYLSALARRCDEDHPVHAFIMRHAGGRFDREAEPVTFRAQALGADVVPDLAFRWALLDRGQWSPSMDPAALIGERIGAFADTMNSIGFFRNEIGPIAQDDPRTSDRIKFYADKGVMLTELAAGTPEALEQLFRDPRYRSMLDEVSTTHLQAVEDWGRRHADTLWTVHGRAESLKGGVTGAKALLSIVNLVGFQTANAAKVAAADSTLGDRLEGTVEVSLATADVAEHILALNGIEKRSLADSASLRKGGRIFAARAGVVLSVASLAGAAWTLYTSRRDLVDAWNRHDTSTLIGSGVTLTGSLLLALHGGAIWLSVSTGLAATGVGIVAAGLILVGGVIVASWKDDECTTLVKSSHFAPKPGLRNRRTFSAAWAGPDQTAEFWPVVAQISALENLSSRFSVAGAVDAPIMPVDGLYGRIDRLDIRLRAGRFSSSSHFTFNIELDDAWIAVVRLDADGSYVVMTASTPPSDVQVPDMARGRTDFVGQDRRIVTGVTGRFARRVRLSAALWMPAGARIESDWHDVARIVTHTTGGIAPIRMVEVDSSVRPATNFVNAPVATWPRA